MKSRELSGIDNSTPVVVLKAVEDRLAHGPLGVARTLGRLGVDVWVICEPDWLPVGRSRYVHTEVVPTSQMGTAALVDKLHGLADRLGNGAVLYSVDDVGTVLIDDHANELRGRYQIPARPRGLVRALADKRRLYQLCTQFDVPTPPTLLPTGWEDVEEFLERFGFPVVLKAADPQRLRCEGGESVRVVSNRSELEEVLGPPTTGPHQNLLLQEFVPGASSDIWMLDAYFDAKGRCLFAVTGRKLRQEGDGPTTLGLVESNEEVIANAIRLLSSIGYAGLVDMGFRFDQRDGEFKLLDVNPRVGSTFRLFTDRAGLDAVRAAYLDMTGQPVPAGVPADGRRWLSEAWDHSTWPDYYPRRTIRPFSVAWSLRQVEEAAWWSMDDPQPFAAMVATRVSQRIRRGRTRHLASGGGPEGPRDATAYFDSQAGFWDEVYRGRGVDNLVYQGRSDRVNRLVAEHCAAGRVLDVGCGAGHLSSRLAAAGFAVIGVDVSTAMLRRARATADATCVDVPLVRASVSALPTRPESFDAVLAIGVLPWTNDAAAVLRDLAGFTRPGGAVIVTADNRYRLTHFLDPVHSPWAQALAESVKRRARVIVPNLYKRLRDRRRSRLGTEGSEVLRTSSSAEHRFHTSSSLRAAFKDAGLDLTHQSSFGFAPTRVAGLPLGERLALTVQRALLVAADHGLPVLRSTGNHLILVGLRPSHAPAPRGLRQPKFPKVRQRVLDRSIAPEPPVTQRSTGLHTDQRATAW